MNTTERQNVKQAIEKFEYRANGFQKLCGRSVKAINIKQCDSGYVADIILKDATENTSERLNDLLYPSTILTN